MAGLREQRVCIKFCFKLGIAAAETHQMLKQAFGDNSLDQTKTYDSYKRFKNGRTSTDDNNCSGRPSTGTTPENVPKAWKSAGNFNNSFKRIQTFFRRLSLVTRVGFMATTLKVSGNHRNGRALLHLGQKEFDKWKRWDRCMHSQRDYFEGDGAE
ncbi:hypothetical protein B7P43_G02460 [Cryptotermes secundus]|uniref:Mos1 transposase HTH domain-containing protein n=1 Tax=Cryptotermes secundus TaxID=105785 RepID=A0A2J7QVD9_9NEOP|nr:hypothetical protein B7P43_G02460 [Cryptotermes secundus]